MAKRKSPEGTDPVSGPISDRVKSLRQQRGWSLEQLAGASGVSRSMLSQIERHEANPTLAVTCKIAQAFAMSLAEFVDVPGVTPGIAVIRASDPGQLYRSDENCEIRTLSPLHLEKDVEFYELKLRPNGILKSAPHFQGTREFLAVEAGQIRIHSGPDVCDLSAGDSANYRADVEHAIENTQSTEALAFLVVIYR